MQKKFFTACVALAALAAFIATPVASASPVLTENGSALSTSAAITGQNTGEARFTIMEITLACTNAHWTGTVTKNTGSQIAFEIPKEFGSTKEKGFVFSGCNHAAWEFKSRLCFESVSGTDSIKITGCGGSIVLLVPTGIITCEYRATSIAGTFATSMDAKIEITEQVFSPTSPCGALGSLSVVFDVTTLAGGTLLIS